MPRVHSFIYDLLESRSYGVKSIIGPFIVTSRFGWVGGVAREASLTLDRRLHLVVQAWPVILTNPIT